MRICVPHVGLSPDSNQGGEVYEREILKHLANLGAEIEVILPRGKRYEKGISNIKVREVPLTRGFNWYGSPFLFFLPLLKVWKEKRFDILRVHSLRNVGTAACFFKILSRIKVPLVSHHHHIDEGDGMIQAVDRFVLNHSDLITVDSRFSKDQLVNQMGIDAEKIHCVYGGIEEKYVSFFPDAEIVDKHKLRDKKVLLFLSALHQRKNAGFMLEIFGEIVKIKQDTVRLVMVGGGDELNRLKHKAERMGISDKVIFTGYIPEETKVSYYNVADCFVFPSIMEGFGLVVGEAMSCGKPVVASRVASLPEMVEDTVTGFLANLDDKNEFVRKILSLLENKDLAQRMGEEGRKRVDKLFRWPLAAQKVLALYEELICA